MTYHYLDTNAVVGWCCADVQPVNAIDSACADAVEQLLTDQTCSVALSELTLIEWHDTVTKLWRSSQDAHFNQVWVRHSMTKVMSAIEDDRLRVISVPPKAAEHAMLLVTLATRDHGLKFKAWDATHLITAVSWSHEVNSQVAIITADADFERFLQAHAYFGEFVTLTQVTSP